MIKEKEWGRGHMNGMGILALVIGNLCSLCAMITDSISSTRKTAKGVLMVQNVSQVFYFLGSIVLKGYSSAVQNAVSFLRNCLAIANISGKWVQWVMVLLGVGLGVYFNNLGLVGWLPILANLAYTLAVFRFKDNDVALKIVFAICVAMFCVFNVFILNFVGVASNFVVMMTAVIWLIKNKKQGAAE